MKAFVINLDKRPERLISFYENNKFPFEVERFRAIEARCGEDGCTLSHLGVIKDQYEFPFVVFEDDCLMIQPWSQVEMAMTQLRGNWDALFLGANLTRPLKRFSRNIYWLKRAYCLHAVVYNSRRMIDFILNNHNTPTSKNLDIFYYRTVQESFNCFITYPIMATQTEGYSDIANKATGSWVIEKSYNEYMQKHRALRHSHKEVVWLQPPH